MEICETSGVPISMVPDFHKRNIYIKGKLRVRRTHRCTGLVRGKPPPIPVRVCKLPRFMGGSIGPRMEICETSGLPNPMVPRLHQSNGYIKRKLRVWRAQKCIGLVGAETVLTSAGPHTTPFHGGRYRAENGNIRNFEPTNPHDTAFAPKTMVISKRAHKCIALVGAETVLTSAGPQTTPFPGEQYWV